MKKLGFLIALVFFIGTFPVHAMDNLKAFPPADNGMVRHVLELPEQDSEHLLKVELVVGKSVEVDSENNYFFAGAIEPQSVQGWGFTRYIVEELGPMAGTLMAVDPNTPKTSRFITLGGEPYLIRYNSKLPVVIYVPEDAEVRYRIWRTGHETKPVNKG